MPFTSHNWIFSEEAQREPVILLQARRIQGGGDANPPQVDLQSSPQRLPGLLLETSHLRMGRTKDLWAPWPVQVHRQKVPATSSILTMAPTFTKLPRPEPSLHLGKLPPSTFLLTATLIPAFARQPQIWASLFLSRAGLT